MNESLPLAALLQESAAAPGFTLEWIDWVGLGLCGLFALLGLVRGLWWQVIRLVGLVGAAFLARFLSGPWGQWVQEKSEMPSEVATGLVWVGVFVLGIAVTAVVGTIGKKSLEAMKLGFVDRFGGMIAGLATGLVLQAAVLVSMAHLGKDTWVQKTLSGTYSKGLLEVVTTEWPILTRRQSEASEYVRTMLEGVQEPPKVEPGPAPEPEGDDKPKVD